MHAPKEVPRGSSARPMRGACHRRRPRRAWRESGSSPTASRHGNGLGAPTNTRTVSAVTGKIRVVDTATMSSRRGHDRGATMAQESRGRGRDDERPVGREVAAHHPQAAVDGRRGGGIHERAPERDRRRRLVLPSHYWSPLGAVRSTRSASVRMSAGTPPAAWKSARATVPTARRRPLRGRPRPLRRCPPGQAGRGPGSPVIASRCSTALVDPPIACSTRHLDCRDKVSSEGLGSTPKTRGTPGSPVPASPAGTRCFHPNRRRTTVPVPAQKRGCSVGRSCPGRSGSRLDCGN